MKIEEIERLSEFSIPIMIGKAFNIEQTKEFIELFFKAVDELKGNQNKESEDKSMLHNVTVIKAEEKVLEEYYVMRGIKEWHDNLGDVKKKRAVICDREIFQYPDTETIAQFLSESGADFVTVEHNYHFVRRD